MRRYDDEKENISVDAADSSMQAVRAVAAFKSSHPQSRRQQKQNIKKQYASARSGRKKAAEGTKKAAEKTQEAVRYAWQHKKGFVIAAGIIV